LAQIDSKVACDSATKICYSTYTSPNGIQYGIALPSTVTAPYDAIISISAPLSVPWAGLAWGGTMVWNPLTVAWPNGKSAVGSSRFALYDDFRYYVGVLTALQWPKSSKPLRWCRIDVPERYNNKCYTLDSASCLPRLHLMAGQRWIRLLPQWYWHDSICLGSGRWCSWNSFQ
jgi:hypothetical protein